VRKYRRYRHVRIQVVSLHKLPLDQAQFKEDLSSLGEEWSDQILDCWNNAWIVVVELDGKSDAVDFGDFSHQTEPGQPESSWQAPWMEQVLKCDEVCTRGAFFLHYVNPTFPLRYRDQQLTFPEPTAPNPDLLRTMRYEAPT
jgi:hypothetical protein